MCLGTVSPRNAKKYWKVFIEIAEGGETGFDIRLYRRVVCHIKSSKAEAVVNKEVKGNSIKIRF